MDACAALREQLKALADPAPSFNDMVVKACALALLEFPVANGSYKDGRFELHSRVNVGVAVAGEGALVVPTVFDAGTRSLGDIARETRALAAKVRDGSIAPPELAGGTFTVSNLGMFGVTGFTAVINPPQAAILAVGAVRELAGRQGRRARDRQAHGDRAHLRSPDPLRRRRRPLHRPRARAARAAAGAGPLTGRSGSLTAQTPPCYARICRLQTFALQTIAAVQSRESTEGTPTVGRA